MVKEIPCEFTWHKGMAPSQKKKNVIELHRCAAKLGYQKTLEVSTKSENQLGIKLSAFNLIIKSEETGPIPLESAFQGSKAFKDAGPFFDLYKVDGKLIKKDERLKRSGPLTHFIFDGTKWLLEPKTAFYDWLYINALNKNEDLSLHITDYNTFTDIEFNPKKSINCQARSCALFTSLKRRGIISDVINDKSMYLDLLEKDSYYQAHSEEKRQGELF